MASEDQLLAAAAAAKPFAAAGEEVVGVVLADPFERGLVFLCALGPGRPDDDADDDDVPELGWIAVDGDGLALADARRVQEAAMLVALCETAEEAALVPDAAEIAEAAERALAARGRRAPRAARRAGGRRAPPRSPPRLTARGCASPARATSTSSQMRRAASVRARQALQGRGAELSASLSGEALDPAEPLARAVWEVLERIAAAGSPEHFSEALGDAAPAISAFAEDVLEHYRAELDDEDGAA